MATVGRVIVDFDANTAKFDKRIFKMQKKLGRFEKRAKGIDRTFSNLFAGVGLIGITAFSRSVVTAGNRMEGFERALMVATGSAAGAARELDFVKDLSDEIGINFEAAAGSFSKFSAAAKGSILAGQQSRDIFTAVSKATRVLNLSAADTGGVFKALEQMMSKGKVQAEELRGQLGERLPGAFNLAAKAMGKTTAELNKMLELGQVTAEDLLPKLAAELEKLYGSAVAEASLSAAANIERFNNELFRTKVAVSEGFLPAVSLITRKLSEGMPVVVDFADKMGEIFAGGKGFGAFADSLDEPIRHLKLERNRVLAAISGKDDPRNKNNGLLGDLVAKLRGDKSLAELNTRLKEINAELSTLQSRQLDAFGGSSKKPVEELNEIFVTSTKRTNSFGVELAGLKKRFASAAEQAASLRSQLELFRDDLSEGQITGIENEIDKILFSGLDEIAVTSKKRLTKPIKSQLTEIEEASKQAARNIQDAFANFLFDPFEDGVKGMVKGFLNAIRRMFANQFAIKMFSIIGPSLGFAVPGKADGGPVAAGSPYMVGERGPELFVPGASGNIIPNNKMGGSVVVNQNYTIAAGADWETLQKILPPLFEQNRLSTIGEIRQLQSEGAF